MVDDEPTAQEVDTADDEPTAPAVNSPPESELTSHGANLRRERRAPLDLGVGAS